MSFGQTGIRKDQFTKLCTEDDFVFSKEELTDICRRMGASEEEREALFEAASRFW